MKKPVLLVLSLLLCGSAAVGQNTAIAIPSVEWDALFTRTEGWTGGDCAGSIELGDGRTVWVFGDSWIGSIAEGKHAPGSHMINNAIGVHGLSALGKGRAPGYRDLEFYWGPDNQDHEPTAWVVPSDQDQHEWYWANGGGIVAPGPHMKPRLIIFLFRVTHKNEEEGTWNFKGTGGDMVLIDNPEDPPDTWQAKTFSLPYQIDETDKNSNTNRVINWGVSAILDHYLYIYGVDDTNPWNKTLHLARVLPQDLEKIEKWEYFSGADMWSSKPSDALPMVQNIVSELSVDCLERKTGKQYIMVCSEPMFGKNILVRTARRPEGPWSEPLAVYTVPGLDRGKEYFTYAAKGHLHLSRPGEILITYIINANNFWDAASDASIYRPRFIRVPLSLILK